MCKDTSEVTAIAAMDGLVLQTLFEAIGQLQQCDRLLCVIYDIPSPEFYQAHNDQPEQPFPYAVAMVLGNEQGEPVRLEPAPAQEAAGNEPLNFAAYGLLSLLSGVNDRVTLPRQQASWQLSRIFD